MRVSIWISYPRNIPTKAKGKRKIHAKRRRRVGVPVDPSVLELTADSLRSSFCVHICRWHAVFVGESQQQDHCALPSRATRRCQWLTVWQQIEPIGTSLFSCSSPSCNPSTARARMCRRLGQPSCVRLLCSVTDELRLSGGPRAVGHDLQRVPDGKRQWKRSRGGSEGAGASILSLRSAFYGNYLVS